MDPNWYNGFPRGQVSQQSFAHVYHCHGVPNYPAPAEHQTPHHWDQHLIYFPVPPPEGPRSTSQQRPPPVPSFFLAQRMTPESFQNLEYLQPVSLSPPMQPNLTTVPVTACQQPPRPPPSFRLVNIHVPAQPGMEQSEQYIVSVPVPSTEFAPIPLQQPHPSRQEMFMPTSSAFQQQLMGSGERDSKPRGSRKETPNEGGTQTWNQEPGTSSGSGGSGEGSNPSDNLAVCKLCLNNREPNHFLSSHTLRDEKGKIRCPVLRNHVCKFCGATGDDAHTLKYCPARIRQDQSEEKVKSESDQSSGYNQRNSGGKYHIRK